MKKISVLFLYNICNSYNYWAFTELYKIFAFNPVAHFYSYLKLDVIENEGKNIKYQVMRIVWKRRYLI